jgi:hypothetical protein
MNAFIVGNFARTHTSGLVFSTVKGVRSLIKVITSIFEKYYNPFCRKAIKYLLYANYAIAHVSKNKAVPLHAMVALGE